MKITAQLQLLPSLEQAALLHTTVERFNAAANWLAGEAFQRQTADKIRLQKIGYATLRNTFGLSSQMACLCISVVSAAYKRDRKIQPVFRDRAAIPYDRRILSFKGLDRVSLLTLSGRVLIPFLMGAYQRERFGFAKGQCDLVYRKDDKWFLLVTLDLPDGTPLPSTDFIGIDLGVVNIATPSDADQKPVSGAEVEQCRQRYFRRRQALQKKAARQKKRGRRPKGVRRALKRASRREAAFRRNTNHVISKSLVALAQGTGRGIALEDLTHIRERTRFRKPQRAKMAGWSFGQLRAFITYKARLAGVPVALVDPRNTSRTCECCGHCDPANRPSQAVFRCQACGYETHADRNGARNIRAKALVSAPTVSERPLGPLQAA